MIPNFNNNGQCFELFSSSTDILKFWKQKGKILKEFESHTKSYIYSLQFGGVSILSIPINEKYSLQINNSCLLFQFILFNTKSFYIEINIKDKSNTKRRFNLTSSVKEVDLTTLYIKIPLIDYPLNIWTNLIIDLEAMTKHYFKTQTFKCLENIHISGCLKIRKIFSLKSKDEPALKSVDMGKSIPIANLFLMESGNLIKKDIKIIGINNSYSNNINNHNVNNNNNHHSKKSNIKSPTRLIKKGNNSPFSSNGSKFSTTSDINLNKYKNYYNKNNINNYIIINENNNNKFNINNDFSEGYNITSIKDIKRKQMENLSKKTKDDLLNTKRFVKGLPNLTNVRNDIKYAVMKNMKNLSNIDNIKGNNYSFEEYDNNISKKLINTNIKEKVNSLGKYIYKYQKNKKRNKSNNPYIRQNLNNDNKIYKNLSTKNIVKGENYANINLSRNNEINIIKNKRNNKTTQLNPLKNKPIINNNNNYYRNEKEKEILNKELHESQNINKNSIKEKNSSNETKFKFNNISLPNSTKDKNYLEKDHSQNKYSNYNNILLDSGIDIKNNPLYDSIEEIAECPGDLIINTNNGENGIRDKIIQLESGNEYNLKSNNNYVNNICEDDFVEFESLFKKKETLRPYTPPIEELVQVNPNKIKGDNNINMDKKNSFVNTNRILKNYENLIYNQDKGLFYDPKTKIYYDVKAK